MQGVFLQFGTGLWETSLLSRAEQVTVSFLFLRKTVIPTAAQKFTLHFERAL